jgi:hypothetical protein
LVASPRLVARAALHDFSTERTMDHGAPSGLLSLTLSLVLCAALAACGGGESGGGGSADGAGPEAAESLATAAPNVHSLNTTAEGTWQYCSPENSTCKFSGTRKVRYGAKDKYKTGTFTDKVACANWQFGDPIYGAVKHCDVWTAAAPALPVADTTTIAPSIPSFSGPRWSDPATWGGVLPVAGAEVVIPAGRTVVLDAATPALSGLRIEGTLRIEGADAALTAGFIDIPSSGALLAGSATAPYTGKAVVTLTGAPAALNDGVSRGLMVRGGRLELYGKAPQPAWTKLNDHAGSGARTLTLKDATDWKAGDTVVVAPTDFYGRGATERIGLAAASGNTLTLVSGLAKPRWGRLQYVTSSGRMSLEPDPTYTPPASPAPTSLDERAAVGNLSRNIVIQGADDGPWQNAGFGAHVMVMELRSKVVLDSVELRRVGQSGITARYPIHWHMLSYSATGTLLGDATGHELRNSTIWQSANRCVVLHATNGVSVRNNICQDIKGHAFFLEDAVERRNVLEGNLALTTRVPADGRVLQVHEKQIFEVGPSGFWLTNPDNTVRGNLAADTQGNGFWLAFPEKTLGASATVPLKPFRTAHGVFEDNTAHSARGPGVMFDLPPKDAAGNVSGLMYSSVGPDGKPQDVVLKRITTFKNGDGGYRNRVFNANYQEWVSADNVGPHFAGSASGVLQRALVVAESLNNKDFTKSGDIPRTYRNEPPSAFATYHSSLAIRDNTVVGFKFVAGRPSGAFKTDDYYLSAVERGTWKNANNRLLGSDPGYRTLPPHLQPGYTEANRLHWTLSGALWDPHGYWGPKGNYSVYDVPFLTAGGNCVPIRQSGEVDGKSCDGQYYGVQSFQTDFDTSRYKFVAPLEATRVDDEGEAIGRWRIDNGATSTMLGWMRHFAARTGGRYVVRFPDRPPPKWVVFNVGNVYRASDHFLIGVAFDGALDATGYVAATGVNREDPKRWKPSDPWYGSARFLKPAASLAEVESAPGADRMWQDRERNLVWIKLQGGLFHNDPRDPGSVPQDDPRNYGVMIYPRTKS